MTRRSETIEQEAHEVLLASELIRLGARMQLLEAEIALTGIGCCGSTKRSAAPLLLKGCFPSRLTGS